MWPFKKNPTPNRPSRKTQDLHPEDLQQATRRQDLFALLELFLVTRVQNELALEEKRADVTLKQAEAKAQTELKLAEIREKRRELRAQQQSFRNKTLPRDSRGHILPAKHWNGCPVCDNPSSPHLTVEMIRAHHQAGHGNGGSTNNNQ